MNKIIELLHAEQCSCVISKGEETRVFNQKGIADLYNLVCRCPHFLEGATVADKVVGKAAAALMIKGGIKQLCPVSASKTSSYDSVRNTCPPY